jgi:hypothetical protein
MSPGRKNCGTGSPGEQPHPHRCATPGAAPGAALSGIYPTDYEDLERADTLAVLVFAARLSQVKCMQPVAE